jgi:hypothetical protein
VNRSEYVQLAVEAWTETDFGAKRLKKEKSLRNMWETRQFLTLGSCRSRGKSSAFRNLAGPLRTDWRGCTLLVGREVKMEIAV